MWNSKWKTLSGASLIGIAALMFAACDNSERVSSARDTAEQDVGQNVQPQAPDEDNLTSDETVGQATNNPAAGGQTQDQAAAGGQGQAGGQTQDQVAEGIDSPFNLKGRAITTADGKPLGQITQLVTDDARNVFAVIEMQGAENTPEASGTMVVDVDDITRSENQLMMSQDANLEPYTPEDYKPIDVENQAPGVNPDSADGTQQ